MIVILDAFTVSRDDLNWNRLMDMDTVVSYDRTPKELVVERCQGADIVLTNKVVLGREEMQQLPGLKYIGVLATGYNVVDIAAAKERGIVVTNIPAYSTDSVAQQVFALLLNAVTRVDHYARENRNGRWAASADFSYLDHRLVELSGKNFGIVGLGNIGKKVAGIALAFGMKVIAYTSKEQQELPEGVRKVDMENLFRESDVLSLHCPLTDSTRWLVSEERLHAMKETAVVINTGRGPLVKDDDMAAALKSGRIAAYCTDVMTVEPPMADNPLFGCETCYTTPHVAWASYEARQRLIDICSDNVEGFKKGEPVNVIG